MSNEVRNKTADIHDAVVASVLAGGPSALGARGFFVAWNGVLVLVYDGFPRPFAAIKAALAARVPTLVNENFGCAAFHLPTAETRISTCE